MNDLDLRGRTAARTAGLRRMRRATRVAAAGAAALAALFAAVAARSAPGHKHAVVTPAATTTATVTSTKIPAPPALPSDSGSSAVTPLAQSPAPVATQDQPVVVSGGS